MKRLEVSSRVAASKDELAERRAEIEREFSQGGGI